MAEKWWEQHQRQGAFNTLFEKGGNSKLETHARELAIFAERSEGLFLFTRGNEALEELCRSNNDHPVPEMVQIETTKGSITIKFYSYLPGKSGPTNIMNGWVDFSDKRRPKILFSADKQLVPVGRKFFNGQVAPKIAELVLDQLRAFDQIARYKVNFDGVIFPIDARDAKLGMGQGGEGLGGDPGFGSEKVIDLNRLSGLMSAKTFVAYCSLYGKSQNYNQKPNQYTNKVRGAEAASVTVDSLKFPGHLLLWFDYGFVVINTEVGHGLYGEMFKDGPLELNQKKLLKSGEAGPKMIEALMQSKGVTKFITTPRRDLREMKGVVRRVHAPHTDQFRKSLQQNEFAELVDGWEGKWVNG